MSSAAVLTPEEMHALREHAQDLGDKETAQSLDLTANDRGMRKGQGALGRALGLFATRIQGHLRAMTRKPGTVNAEPVEVIGPDAGNALLEELACVVAVRAPDSGLVGYLGIDAAMAFSLVERAFGATKGVGAAPTRTRLTRLEMETVLPFVTELVGHLSKGLNVEEHQSFGYERLSTVFQPELPAGVASLGVWRCDAAAEPLKGQVVVILLPPLTEIATRGQKPVQTVPPVSQEARLAKHLLAADVTVCGTLGLAHVSVAELLALRPGDLIRLDGAVTDSVVVSVQGHPKFIAQPLQRAGALAVTVEKALK
jgi:flagellar motor switch protein FliM